MVLSHIKHNSLHFKSKRTIKNTLHNTPKENKEKRKKPLLLQTVFVATVAFCILGIVSVALVFFLLWLQRMPYFTLETIEVRGVKRLSSNDIATLAGVKKGQNILTVHIGAMYERLQKSPWIKDVIVRRTLPDTLRIDIKEVNASFWVQHNDTLYYADSLGFPISPVENTFFVSLPVLEVEKGAEDLVVHLPAIVQEIKKTASPMDSKSIAWVKVLPTAQIQFFIEPLNIVVELAIADWMLNMAKVHIVLQDLIQRGTIRSVRSIHANTVVRVVER